MKKITSLVAALLLSVATFAQAPQGFSYQAVVRDAHNAIVANQTVDVTLTITAEIDGEAVQTYAEKHSVTTNANGLFTLVVGQGESKQKLSDIKWNMPNAIYNMRTETAYGTATTQLLSVPFALYAEQAGELDYQKLAKTLTSDEVQALLGYVKANDLADYAKKSDIPAAADLSGFAKTDTLGSYALNSTLADYAKTTDVANGYVTKETFENYVLSGGDAESVDLTVYAKTADVEAAYAKKTDIPAAVNYDNFVTKRYLADSANFITEHQSLAGYARIADIDSTFARKSDIPAAADLSSYAKTADVAAGYVSKETFDNYVLSGGQADSVDLTVYAKTADVEATYAKKTDIPAAVNYDNFVTKRYLADSANFITEHQSLAGYARIADIDSTYARKSDIPAAADLSSYAKTADVAAGYVSKETFDNYVLSGGQADSVDLTVYAKTADVEAAYATKAELSAKADAASLATVATSGSYNDLTNKPVIPAVPTNVSAFTNDANYLTEHQSLADYAKTADVAASYVTKEEFDDYVLSGGQADSVDLTVYAKTADVEAAYATKAELSAKADAASLATVATSGSYNDLTNKPVIPTVPTNVSAFTNDANYLTEHQSLADYATKAQLNDSLAAYAKSADLSAKANTADLATVAISGSYNDLTNKPAIPTVPTNVSAFTNDAGYLTATDVANNAGKVNKLDKVMKENFGNELALSNSDVVDLGLSSGNLWASCNLGADSPEQDGGYYAWGETSTKDNYTWDTYQYGSSATTLTKYCTKAANGNNGFTDALNTLEVGDDAAAANLGIGWVMPTNSEWQELYDQCYWEQTSDYNGTGVAGFIVYKSVDKTLDKQQTKGSDHVYTLAAAHIFLPFAGSVNGSAFQFRQVNPYWASTIVSDEPNNNPQNAHCIRICDNGNVVISSKTYPTYAWGRNAGCPVRPIRHADATALPKKTSQLTADKIGDMPMATVNVTVTTEDDVVATVSFLGRELTSGTTSFRIPAYSPVFLSVSLSKYSDGNRKYSYMVKINGKPFDPVTGYYYAIYPSNAQNLKIVGIMGTPEPGDDRILSGDYYGTFSESNLRVVKTPIYKTGSGKSLEIPAHWFESDFSEGHAPVVTDAERNMVNQVVGPFPNAVNTIEITVGHIDIYN